MSNVIKSIQTNARMSHAVIANGYVDMLLAAACVEIAVTALTRNES
jgi:hypothetical protein